MVEDQRLTVLRKVYIKWIIWMLGIGGLLGLPFALVYKSELHVLTCIALLLSAIWLQREI